MDYNNNSYKDLNISEPVKSDAKTQLLKLLSYWPRFLICFLIFLLFSFIYLRYTVRIYETTAKIKILNENSNLEIPTSAFIINRSNINLENESEILKSYRIASQVVSHLNLSTRFYKIARVTSMQIDHLPFEFIQRIPADSIEKTMHFKITVSTNGFEVFDGEDVWEFADFDSGTKVHSLPFDIRLDPNTKYVPAQYEVELINKRQAILDLKSALTVNPIGESSDLLTLKIRGRNMDISEAILNTIIEVFNADDVNDRQLVWERTLDFVDDRFSILSSELDSIEAVKKEYKVANNLVDIISDVGINLQQKQEIDGEVFLVENQLEISRNIRQELNKPMSVFTLLPSNLGIDNPQINNLINAYNEIILDRQKLINTAGPNNPSVSVVEQSIVELKKNLNSSISNYLNQMESTMSSFYKRQSKLSSQVLAIPEKEQQLRAIERQQGIKESLYLFLLQKREEAAVNLAVTEPSLKVVEYALTNHHPISPRPKIIYTYAFILSFLVPYSMLYIYDFFDTKVHLKTDLEPLVKTIPIISEIPKTEINSEAVFTDPNTISAIAESFRIMTTNLNFLLPNIDGGKVVYCSSTIQGEGKTFVSLNLSLALSSLNKKVLIIGGDLRNPQLHSYTSLNKNVDGLTNYLIDPKVDWKSNVKSVFNKHFCHHILFSGPIPPNPTHLLANGNFGVLLKEARNHYDFIVVDLAPTLLVTDTILVSKYADVTLCVVRSNVTDKKIIPFSVELSKRNQLKNMAYVINAVDRKKGIGYNYGYEYTYGK